MKSERGVTLTSIMIYVMALTAAVVVIGRIITYFYSNINYVSTNTAASAEITKFNTYFTDDINVEGNQVAIWDNVDNTYIVFSKTNNQYTYKDGGIYLNKAKICKDVDSCEFYYSEYAEQITVNIKIGEKEFNMTYSIVK